MSHQIDGSYICIKVSLGESWWRCCIDYDDFISNDCGHIDIDLNGDSSGIDYSDVIGIYLHGLRWCYPHDLGFFSWNDLEFEYDNDIKGLKNRTNEF